MASARFSTLPGVWKERLVAATPERWRGHWQRLEQSPLGGRLARGAFWSLAGGVAARSLGLLAGILVARLLGRDRYGDMAMIQSTVGLFGVLAGAGMGVTATKHVAEWRRQDPGRAARLIRLSNGLAWAGGALVTALVGWWAPALARYAMGLPELGMELRFSAGLLLFGAVQGAQAGALAGLESFRVLARLNLLTGLVSCPFLVLGAWMGGVAGTIWGLNGAAALGCLLHHLALRQETARAGLADLNGWGSRDLPVLWRFTLPAALGALVTAAVQCGCMSLIARQPAGREALGAFNAANQWFLALMFLPNLLAQSVLPLMSEQLGQARHRQGRRLLGLSIKLNLLVVVPVLVLCALSPWLMHLFGRSFRGEWPTLVAVLLTAVFLSIQTPVGQVLTAGGRVWVGLWMNLGWAAVFVAGTVAWGSWGALGLATARLAAYAAHTVWAMWYALRLLRRED